MGQARSDRVLSPWALRYDRWDPAEQPLREALTTLGNGYFATRGAAEEHVAGGPHYPGTYLAGGYDRQRSLVAGRWVENEDLVNWPNWLALSFRYEGGDWLDLDRLEVLSYRQELDLRRGVLERQVRVRDHRDRETELVSRRIVHMQHPHRAALEWRIRPCNWSGRVHVRSALDGNVENRGVPRYRELESKHLEVLGTGLAGEEVVHLSARTLQSGVSMTQAARLRVTLDGSPASIDRRTVEEHGFIAQELDCEVGHASWLRVEKVVALYTSRDRAIADPLDAATRDARDAPGFDALLASHVLAWKHVWARCDIDLADDEPSTQAILRLHLFHLLQSVSPHTTDLDVGVTARGLHGEAYRGHVFWDELFIFPLLNLSMPEVTRALLMYRYRRLGEARRMAREAGYEGAMYPWQSGSDGREETQVLHLNPRSGHWVPDETRLQFHVSSAIAYNVWQYYEVTGDEEFLYGYGAPMLLEIARFWASIAHYDAKDGRYHIRGVVGPDEYHTRHPGAEAPGLDDNAYTNVLATWTLRAAGRALNLLPETRRAELFEELGMSDDDVVRFDSVASRMHLPFLPDGMLAQFEGYAALEELDWGRYTEKYGNIQRIDRILEAEGDDPNRYKASKQADVLMLFYLFSADELRQLVTSMGYSFDAERIGPTIEYYAQRTSHGSTLSRVVHAWVLARSDRARSFALFRQALRSDIEDAQGGTTAEGIHLGAMAGTVDLAQRCYGGIETRDGMLWLNPRLPEELSRIGIRVRYRGQWLDIEMTHHDVRVTLRPSAARTLRVSVCGELHELAPGDSRIIALGDRCTAG
jgi:trehalose/maltose hydrolase-like predicted phosphorylase